MLKMYYTTGIMGPFRLVPSRLGTDSIAALEALRRSRTDSNLKSEVLTGPEGAWRVDYASAGLKVDAARAALDEGIPNKQPERVALAYALLLEGTVELGLWLKENGYPVGAFLAEEGK